MGHTRNGHEGRDVGVHSSARATFDAVALPLQPKPREDARASFRDQLASSGSARVRLRYSTTLPFTLHACLHAFKGECSQSHACHAMPLEGEPGLVGSVSRPPPNPRHITSGLSVTAAGMLATPQKKLRMSMPFPFTQIAECCRVSDSGASTRDRCASMFGAHSGSPISIRTGALTV